MSIELGWLSGDVTEYFSSTSSGRMVCDSSLSLVGGKLLFNSIFGKITSLLILIFFYGGREVDFYCGSVVDYCLLEDFDLFELPSAFFR